MKAEFAPAEDGDEIQKSGRSAARLIEDLLRYVPGSDSLGLSPLEASQTTPAKPLHSLHTLEADTIPKVIESFNGTTTVLYAILSNRRHVEVQFTRGVNGNDYDFHLVTGSKWGNLLDERGQSSDTVAGDSGDLTGSDFNTSASNSINYDHQSNQSHPRSDFDDNAGPFKPPGSPDTGPPTYTTFGSHASNTTKSHSVEPYSSQTGSASIYTFKCIRTNARLKLIIRPPEFSHDDLADFDSSRILARYNIFKHLKPSAPLPSPAMCFYTLYKILVQPLTSNEPREIYCTNPTLNMRINPEILHSFHFTKNDERQVWTPPLLNDISSPETMTSAELDSVHEMRKQLSRKLLEIAVLGTHANERSPSSHGFTPRLENAVPFLRKILNSSSNSSGYSGLLSNTEYGNYVCLGATDTMNDDLILRCYENQVHNDPENAPYYMEALLNIANLRGGEDLQLKAVQLRSLGVATISEINDSYKALGLSDHTENIDSSRAVLVMEAYRSALKENPDLFQSLNKALSVVAEHSQDFTLQQFYMKQSIDVDQAYYILGISRETPDDMVALARDTHVADNPSLQQKCNTAFAVIAENRQSPRLLTIYEAHNDPPILGMDVDTAYALLGIDSTVSDFNDIIAIFDVRLKDNPEKILELRQALRLIGHQLPTESRVNIENFLSSGEIGVPRKKDIPHWPYWPVGLDNIGNTCYLNSLLQNYFTIKPLREAVLEFIDTDGHALPDLNTLHSVKVGGRQVQPWEAKRAREFASLLARLFDDLIHTEKTSVAPANDLAYLALVSDRDDDEIEAHDSVEEIHEAESNDVIGPLPDPKVMHESDRDFVIIDEDEDERLHRARDRVGRNDSIVVVLDSPEPEDEEEEELTADGETTSSLLDDDIVMTDKPIAAPQLPQRINGKRKSIVSHTEVSPEPSEPKEPTVTVTHIHSGEKNLTSLDKERSEKINRKLIGGQQDVTECISNVLFQLQVAFPALGFDDDGEKLDLIKDLYYGKTKQVLESATDGSDRREKIERFDNLLVNVTDETTDLYEALDVYFRDEFFTLDSIQTRRLLTITHLPPILQIHIQRVQYDLNLKMPVKSNVLLKFDDTIYMDRYLDSVDQVLLQSKRNEIKDWKIQIGKLEEQLEAVNSRGNNGLTTKDTLAALRDWLRTLRPDSEYAVSPKTLKILDAECQRLTEEVSRINQEIDHLKDKIVKQFDFSKKAAYRLHSAFIHRGEATFGHYWIYIKDFKTGRFRKYNDDRVTEVEESEVFYNAADVKASPYFLVFVREDLTDQIVDPVRRGPFEHHSKANSVSTGHHILEPVVELPEGEVETGDIELPFEQEQSSGSKDIEMSIPSDPVQWPDSIDWSTIPDSQVEDEPAPAISLKNPFRRTQENSSQEPDPEDG